MSALAALTGDYVDIKFVKGRKVAQIVIEIPIEKGADFVAAFGAPNPATTIPVAIARLDASMVARPKGGKLAQRAGILCSEGAFAVFLTETKQAHAKTPDDCKQALYRLCGITSRAELDHNALAGTEFESIESSYRVWLKVAA